ncbi:MAG: antitoxin PrlF [Bradyrhizobium sp.]|jgi:hypothetical protein|nr:antitoxin PrlF [Bradyrhizobium sp.]
MATKVAAEGQVIIRNRCSSTRDWPRQRGLLSDGADGTIVLEKAEAAQALPPSRFEELVGIAGPGLSTDEIMAMTRGE